jgi:hypothetical protein
VRVTGAKLHFALRLDNASLLGPKHEVKVATVSCTKLLAVLLALLNLVIGRLRNSLRKSIIGFKLWSISSEHASSIQPCSILFRPLSMCSIGCFSLDTACLIHSEVQFANRAVGLGVKFLLVVDESRQFHAQVLFIHEVAGGLLEDRRRLFVSLPDLHSSSVHGVLVASNSCLVSARR